MAAPTQFACKLLLGSFTDAVLTALRSDIEGHWNHRCSPSLRAAVGIPKVQESIDMNKQGLTPATKTRRKPPVLLLFALWPLLRLGISREVSLRHCPSGLLAEIQGLQLLMHRLDM